jgi:hypothetical protein
VSNHVNEAASVTRCCDAIGHFIIKSFTTLFNNIVLQIKYRVPIPATELKIFLLLYRICSGTWVEEASFPIPSTSSYLQFSSSLPQVKKYFNLLPVPVVFTFPLRLSLPILEITIAFLYLNFHFFPYGIHISNQIKSNTFIFYQLVCYRSLW